MADVPDLPEVSAVDAEVFADAPLFPASDFVEALGEASADLPLFPVDAEAALEEEPEDEPVEELVDTAEDPDFEAAAEEEPVSDFFSCVAALAEVPAEAVFDSAGFDSVTALFCCVGAAGCAGVLAAGFTLSWTACAGAADPASLANVAVEIPLEVTRIHKAARTASIVLKVRFFISLTPLKILPPFVLRMHLSDEYHWSLPRPRITSVT